MHTEKNSKRISSACDDANMQIYKNNYKSLRGLAPVWPTIVSRNLSTLVVFTALHEMQTRSSDGNYVCPSVCLSVCPSVRLSVRQTRALWQNGRKLYLDFYIIRKNIYPSFLRRRMVGGGRPLLPEILGRPARVGAKSPILNR